MTPWTIYAIIDGTIVHAGCIKYVGRTKRSLAQRFYSHLHSRTAIAEWIKANPHSAGIVLLETVPDEPWEGSKAEARWIEKYRAQGQPMLNVWPMPDNQREEAFEQEKQK